VTIAMDGATHIPTRVQVFAAGGSKPSFEVGFTSFDPTTPSASVFEFNPPPGATVTEGLMGQGATAKGDAPAGTDESRADRPDVVGSGWSSVVTTTLPHAPSAPPNTSGDSGDSEGSRPLSIDSIVKSLPAVSGAWGSGHLLRGTLFSVVVTHDGRVAAGAVEPERLYAVLAAQ
jgi:hypothetical protein